MAAIAAAIGPARTTLASLGRVNRQITTAWVDIDGMRAYTATPPAPRRAVGVLVGSEIFGLTGYLRRMTDRLARLGYAAIAPDFNHRTNPRPHPPELPPDAAGRERGLELAWLLTRQEVLDDARAALAHLREHAGTRHDTAVGFSLGGHVACAVAGELGLQATVALYPGWLTGTQLPLSRPQPTLERAAGATGRLVVLLGADDPIIDAQQQQAIAERLETVVYPGATHGFAADERDTYHPASAEDAWRRIEDVLRHIG